MIIKILNLLLPIINGFFDFEKISKKQNYWNDSKLANSRTKKIGSGRAQQIVSQIPVSAEINFSKPLGDIEHRVTSPYGWRKLNIDGKQSKQFHIGVDIGGENEVIAIEDCLVQRVLGKDSQHPVRFKKEKGTWIDLIKSEKIPAGRAWTPYIILVGTNTKAIYKYKHVHSNKRPGSAVLSGEKLGISGNLGYSMGAHLHLEIYPFDERTNSNPKPVDPIKWLKEQGLEV